MAVDYTDSIFRLSADSDVVRIRSGAVMQVVNSGTDTIVWEGVTDSDGGFQVSGLDTGKYDLRVDGSVVRTFHHVKSDHTHIPVECWQFFKSGAITGDQDEVNTMQIYGAGVAGSIIKVMVMAQNVDATGDVTVHLLKGLIEYNSNLTVASNSAWSYKINPGAAKNRYLYTDDNPGISLSNIECLTVGIDYTATAVAGLTVLVIFRPN